MSSKPGRDDELPELAPQGDGTDAGSADETVKGGALPLGTLTSASVLKQASQISTSVDPGRVQGFSCDGRA